MHNVIMVSGGFDPIHMGHINLFKNASKYGEVVVILNSDDWLIRKKGFFFQSWEDRKGIISSLKFVSSVVPVDDTDGTVCSALREYRPGFFGNGGDRKADNTPELSVCDELGIGLIWSLGEPSTDMLHSSHILRQRTVERDWGRYELLASGDFYQVKRLIVDPGKGTSVQYHKLRDEYIFGKDSKAWVKPGQIHQIKNDHPVDKLELIEVQIGDIRENDIVRLTPNEYQNVVIKHRIG